MLVRTMNTCFPCLTVHSQHSLPYTSNCLVTYEKWLGVDPTTVSWTHHFQTPCLLNNCASTFQQERERQRQLLYSIHMAWPYAGSCDNRAQSDSKKYGKLKTDNKCLTMRSQQQNPLTKSHRIMKQERLTAK